MNLTSVETEVFTQRWHKRLDAEALREMQNVLLEDARRGDPIPGCGVLRKLRFGDESRGKGKRGGVRVIYVHTPDAFRIDLVTVYGKDEADDLTKDQVELLCRLAGRLREEARAAFNRSGAKRGKRR